MSKLVPSETADLFKGKGFRLSSLEHDLGTENTKALILVDGVKVFFVIFLRTPSSRCKYCES